MSSAFQQNFFQQCPNIRQTCDLFEQLPNIYFILKNVEGKFVFMNTALASWLKLEDRNAAIGLSDYDLYPENLAKLYRQEDEHVITSTEEIAGEIHQVVNRSGQTSWLHVVKKPVMDVTGCIVGTIGMMRESYVTGESASKYKRMEKVIKYIYENYDKQLTVGSLAEMSHVSTSHLQRMFRDVFKMSPMKMVMQTRIRAARHLLLNTNQTVTEIAHRAGFYDHSHFIKQFQKDLGMSPTEFKKEYS